MKTFYVRQGVTPETFADLATQVEGSTWDGRQLLLDSATLKIKSSLYYELSEMDIAVNEIWSAEEEVLIKDTEGGENAVLMRFLQQAKVYQEETSQTIGKSNQVGASMYNTLHPMGIRCR